MALLARGEERGCVALSEIDELVQALELSDEDVEAIESAPREPGHRAHRRLRSRGRRGLTLYRNGELAAATTDALQLFLNEIRRYPLLTAAEEIELAKRIEAATSRPRSG